MTFRTTKPFLFAAGLAATTPPGQAAPLANPVGPYEIQILVDGQPAPSFAHRRETWVLGRIGERYTVRVINRSERRIEAVVSVDGRDVIDGRSADWRQRRGYLVSPWGEIEIEGWRTSLDQVATFRFAGVDDSYAADQGSVRDVGVIGVAVFPERRSAPRPLQVPPVTDQEQRGDPDARREGSAGAAEAGKAAVPDAASASERSAPSRRPGLGTAYGDPVRSAVREVEFERASARPEAVLGLRYDDRRGLEAIGIDVDGPLALGDGELRRSADPFRASERRFAPPPAGWPYR